MDPHLYTEQIHERVYTEVKGSVYMYMMTIYTSLHTVHRSNISTPEVTVIFVYYHTDFVYSVAT